MGRLKKKRKYTKRVHTSKNVPVHLQTTVDATNKLIDNFNEVYRHNMNKLHEICAAQSIKIE